MYSLDNSYSKEDLFDWEKRLKKLVEGPLEYTCELKYDGASISITYENGSIFRALTRGDGTQGDDVTANIKTIKSVPLKLIGNYPDFFEIRGEIILPYEGFKELNKQRILNGEEPFKKSHKKFGYDEPFRYYDPSIGPSQIIRKHNDNQKFYLTTLKSERIYEIKFDESFKKIINEEMFTVGERIRDILYLDDGYYALMLDSSPAIGIFNSN